MEKIQCEKLFISLSLILFFAFCTKFTHIFIFIFIIFTTHYYGIPYTEFSSASNCLSHVHATIWKKGNIGSTPKSLVVIVLYTIKYNKEAKSVAVYFTFPKKKS